MRGSQVIHMMPTVATTPLANSVAGVARDRPSTRGEFWFVFAMLLVMAAFPAISKYQGVEPQDSMSSPVGEAVWSLLYLVAGLRVLALRATAFAILKQAPGLVLLLGIFLASSIWSVAPSTTLVDAIELIGTAKIRLFIAQNTTLSNAFELIGTATISLFIVCRFDLREFLNILGLAFGVIAVASLGFVFLAPGHGRMDYGSGPWSGVFQAKNNLALAMSLATISLTISMLASSGRKRAVLALVIAMCIALLVGSRSATATMGCCAALAAAVGGLVVRSERVDAVGRMLIGISLLVGIVVVAVVGVSLDTFLGALGRDVSLTGRTDFWPYLLQAISDRPLLGYGYNAFFRSTDGAHYLSYYAVEAGGWMPYHSHNSFLQCGLDAGFVGLTAFGYVLLGALRGGVLYLRREKSVVAAWPIAIVFYLIAGSFTETYFNQFNTYESILFYAALLYPLRGIVRKDALSQRDR